MVSTDKLIKVGVRYSDKYFETLKNIYNNAYRNNDSLEDFLNETKDYSIGNPLEAGGFKEQLTNLVVASTNDIRFSRPAQKALMNTIISNTTGELITNVGDDIKAGVRDIVSRGYREGKLNHNRVADEINSKLDGINRKRARTIARTEIKRAQTTSNYVVARERGANAYQYKCGAKPCDICIEDCGETFPIDDMEHLPPRHPNCMCGVSFFKDPSLPDVESTSEEDENNTPITTPSNAVNNSILSNNVKKHFDEFADKTGLANSEYQQYVSSTGELSPLSTGGRKSVKTSQAQEEWIEKQNKIGNDVYATHNHSYRIDPKHNTPNTNTMFSLGDLQTFADNMKSVKSLSAEGPCNRVTITRVKEYTDGMDLAISKMMQAQQEFTKKVIDAPTPNLRYLRGVKQQFEELGYEGVDLRKAMEPYERKAAQFNTDVYFNEKKIELLNQMDEIGREVGIRVTNEFRVLDSLKGKYTKLNENTVDLTIPKINVEPKSVAPKTSFRDTLNSTQQKEFDKLSANLDKANKDFAKATSMAKMKKAKAKLDKAKAELESFKNSI